jgi:predicted transcriptional regulator
MLGIMPNQRAKNMRHTSVTLPDALVAKLDQIAIREERSRNKIIEMILREQVALFEQSVTQPAVQAAPKKTAAKGRSPTNTDPVPSNGAGA